MEANNYLKEEKISKLMVKYAIPCIISLLVGALYNIVDQIFIANASYLGSFGNAANTVIFPLTVIALAIAVMIGDGACAFVSICLGKKEHDKVNKTVGNAISLVIISSLVLMGIYLLFDDALISMFGGKVNERTFDLSKEYFFYISLGIPFYMFGQAMNPIIRSDGNPRFAMIATLVGAIVNIILDPIFIYPCKMGMMGAAVATVIGQVATAILSLIYILRAKVIKVKGSDLLFSLKIINKFIPLGICSLLSQLSLVFAMAATNNMVKKYGAMDSIFGTPEYAQIPMAVIGIVMKFFQIVISITVGMAAGCIPLVGYNKGANEPKRVKEILNKLLISEFIVGLVALGLVEGGPKMLINIFGAKNESEYYTSFALKAFRIYLCFVPLATINKASFIFLQSLGKPFLSTFLSLVREVVFGVGFVLVLPLMFKLNGVLYSMPASDILTFIITVVVLIKVYKELNNEIRNNDIILD